MNIGGYFKTQLQRVAEEVKSSLPDDISFDFRRHVLPLFFPFLSWKDDLKQPGVLRADLMAGIIGAFIVLPQGVAFALIAGLPPVYGLYTAMVTPIIAGLFCSSRHAVSGPTAAISLVIFAAVSKLAEPASPEYVTKVLFITFIAGAIQLAMGLGRMGRYVSFVSQAVIVGFTAGAAVLTITNQLDGALGLDISSRATFLETWEKLFEQIANINWAVFSVTAYTLIMSVLVRKYAPHLPHLLIGLALGTALAWIIGGPDAGIPFATEIPRKLPSLSMPEFSASNFHSLVGDSFAIAILGIIQTIAVSRAIAVHSGQQINGNQELFGQGLSNVVGSFFSCYTGSGSLTRSALNYEAGARTPMSAIFAALALTAIVLLLAPYAMYLPMPAFSGLILLIGWSLIDFKHMREIRIASKQDNLILGATFFATLFAELQFAVFLGVLLSLYFFLRRTSKPNVAVMAPDGEHYRHQFVNIVRKDVPQCPQLKIVRIDGQLYFGAIDHVDTQFRIMRKGPEKHLLLMASGINYVDLDGAEWLAREAAYYQKKGGGLYIIRLKVIAQDVMESGGYIDEIGRDNFFVSKTDAIKTIYSKLDPEVCEKCRYRVFFECMSDPRLPKLDLNTDALAIQKL